MKSYRVDKQSARIDLSRPLSFMFDGKTYSGFAGDTLASALLANGARTLARSFKYGRPRGIVGAGPEEPNVLVQLETGPVTIPNLKATQVELYDGLAARRTTGWPSLDYDLKSVGGHFARFMPAGFYYKTFQSRALWPRFEHIIRQAAGYGSAPVDPDPETYDHKHHHTEVLVVGGDSAGSAELYDPATGTWNTAGTLSRPRRIHQAVRLANGKALVIGGAAEPGPISSTELYDPTTGT